MEEDNVYNSRGVLDSDDGYYGEDLDMSEDLNISFIDED